MFGMSKKTVSARCPSLWRRLFSSSFCRGWASLSLWPSHRSFEDQVNARLREAGLSEMRPLSEMGTSVHADANALVAQAWQQVGDHMRTAMAQVEREMTPQQRERLRCHRDRT
jgi:hypothetical protein